MGLEAKRTNFIKLAFRNLVLLTLMKDVILPINSWIFGVNPVALVTLPLATNLRPSLINLLTRHPSCPTLPHLPSHQ